MKSRHSVLLCCLFPSFFVVFEGKSVENKVELYPLLMPDVQPLIRDTYLCTSFKMPRSDFQYIVGFTPNVSIHTAHHMLIFGCELPGKRQRDRPKLVWDCGHGTGNEHGLTCKSGSQIVYSWSKEAPPLDLPEGVAFKVGKGTGINHLVLQVHYAHVEPFLNGGTDNSGIILSMLPSTTNKVTKTAGVYVLGTRAGMIRAGDEEHFETSCRIEERVVLHPFAFQPHTHALGKVVSGFKIDKDGKWHLIGKHDPQEPQMFYPVTDNSLVLEYGDILAARCTMFNFRDENTSIGPTGNDEMCNFYMMYYVDGDKLLHTKYCFSEGPKAYYWNIDPKIEYIPPSINKSASSLDA